ncbi:MAG: hypothetical protein M3394_08025, partial [Actinomycetota bacterium]|nr:hypothetical protein [Actinomycetota bacterium]
MNRGAPTPPIELGGTELRLLSPRVEPSDATLDALAAVCAVSTEESDVVEHGRDWWPLAMVWA